MIRYTLLTLAQSGTYALVTKDWQNVHRDLTWVNLPMSTECISVFCVLLGKVIISFNLLAPEFYI
jgi:hypothetical protein